MSTSRAKTYEGELVGVRGYRRGDPMRSIHWRQTARHDALIVRERTDSGRQSRRCTVILDTRSRSYADAAADPFERAVSLAAGLLDTAVAHGITIDLVLPAGRYIVQDQQSRSHALDALAAASLDTQIDAAPWASHRDGLVLTTSAAWHSDPYPRLQPFFVHERSSMEVPA